MEINSIGGEMQSVVVEGTIDEHGDLRLPDIDQFEDLIVGEFKNKKVKITVEVLY